MSGFFASQSPVDAPRTRRKPREPLSPIIKQKADRFESLSRENLHGEYLPVPATVRLVATSPSPETTPSRSSGSNNNINHHNDDDDTSRTFSGSSHHHGPLVARPRSALLVKDTSVSHSSISRHGRVSDMPAAVYDYGSTLTLVANDSGHELPKLAVDQWTISDRDYSPTLNESEVGSRKISARFSSQGTSSTGTRRTITPVFDDDNNSNIEGDGVERDIDDDIIITTTSGRGTPLPTLEEASAERLTTVREVPLSDSSSTDELHSDTSSRHPGSTPQLVPRKSLKRAHSTGSLRRLPSIYNLREVSTSPAPRDQDRQEPNWNAISSDPSSPSYHSYHPDLASSPRGNGAAAIHSYHSTESISEAGSPNFRSYGSDSSLHHSSPSGPHFINNAVSIESIHSRLHQARTDIVHELNPSSSWTSLVDEDYDTLPPLHIPKKRAKHTSAPLSSPSQYTSAPLFDHSSFAGVGPSYVGQDMEEIDTLPYPKRPFSSHLSTIASESDRHSRSASRHMSHLSRLSHFSLGSGVLTGDEESFVAASPTIAQRRRRSLPSDSFISNAASSAFEDDVPDLTTYREASAVPQPLFRAGQATMLQTTKKYHGPLPPLPPIPTSPSNEDIDTLSALPSPSLKQQKSSRSLKHQRSNPTPSHSRHPSQVSTVDTVRHSAGSSIFPTWAKQYYTGNVALPSKLSLSSLRPTASRPHGHARTQSAWTDRSITSRLGTGYSDVEPASPVSSHFLPSIFRPKSWHKTARKLQKSNQSVKSGRSLKSRFSGRTGTMHSRPDSMIITPNPLSHHPTDENNNSSTDVLPSGQPKYGKLKGGETPSPRLPRKYSKQKLWDTMEFPRPMTKDRMSSITSFSRPIPSEQQQPPHLGPATRASQQKLPRFKAPSFVESLDTLIKSRCNRQILLFVLGFLIPVAWWVGAVLPLPKQPTVVVESDDEKGPHDDVMMRHEVTSTEDSERRCGEERTYAKARWWRRLNRVMSIVGVGVVAAIVSFLLFLSV